MKTHGEATIEAAVERAKAEMRVLLATGRVFKYGRLCQILAAADPISRLIEELESHFLVVTDVPPPLPTTTERSGPSSSRATQPPGLDSEPSESSSVSSGKRSGESSGETFQWYGIKPWVTSQRARRVFKTATKSLTDTDKSLVADYLTHLIDTAEKQYPMKQTDNVVRASQLLDLLAGQSSTDRSEGESSRTAHSIAHSAARQKAETTDLQMDFEVAYNRLVEQHPVTLEGEAPDKALCADISPSFQRKLYERWVKAQMKLRKQHIHSHFGPRLPSEEKVSKWISDRGWRTNIPGAAQFVKEWKPHGSVDTAMDAKQIRRLTRTQKWKGLLVTEDGGKGKGVIATRRFLAGEVVCDYHGQVVTASEGHSTHSTVSAEDGVHMFFFENMNGQAMCIDAHSPCCECHPDRQSFGRLINHSRKRCNLRPRAYTLQNGEDIIIFLATKNIKENEELLFGYGVERRSFYRKGFRPPLGMNV